MATKTTTRKTPAARARCVLVGFGRDKAPVLWTEHAHGELLALKRPVADVRVQGKLRPESVRVDVIVSGLADGSYLLYAGDPFTCAEGDALHVDDLEIIDETNTFQRSRMPWGWYHVDCRAVDGTILLVPFDATATDRETIPWPH